MLIEWIDAAPSRAPMVGRPLGLGAFASVEDAVRAASMSLAHRDRADAQAGSPKAISLGLMAVIACDEPRRWGVWGERFSPRAEAPKAPEIVLMAGRCRRDQLKRTSP